jgi:hypothetical protein
VRVVVSDVLFERFVYCRRLAGAENSSEVEMDRSIKPGDDFYRYANGGWLGTVAIPAGHSSYDTRAMLMERAHIAAVLKLAGVADTDSRAARIYSLESRIAQAFAPDAMPLMSSNRTTSGSAVTSKARRRA